MSPVTKSPYNGANSPLRPVNLSPSRYHSGRWFLLAEALLVAGLGVYGLLAEVITPDFTARGVAVALRVASTPAHCWLLIVFSVLAALATLRRRTTLIMTGVGVGGFLLLFTIGTVAAVRSAPGPLGFNASESVLHAVLMAINLGLLLWLLANALEGPAWVRRRRPRGSGSGDSGSGNVSGGDDSGAR